MSDFDNQNTPDIGGNAPQEPDNGYQPAPEQPGYQAPPQQPGYQAPPQGGYQQPPQGGYQQPPQGGYQQPDYQQYAGQQGQPFQQTINIQTPPPPPYEPKSKMAAGLLGIFLGSLGIHNFYLGYTGKALAQLLITLLTCGVGATVTGIWGLIEGIMILTGSIAVDGKGVPLRD